jgi:hypothetical protein
MSRSHALGVAVGTFVLGLAVAVAVFAALDVGWIFLIGPAMGIAIAAHAAYRTALEDRPRRGRG